MSRLRGVVLGVGRMGGHHLRKLSALPGIEVRAVDPPRGLPGPVGRPDFAVVAVPTALHLELALPLLEAGVPCLVEKPLAATVAEARRLAAFPHCFPGHVERFNPALRALEAALDGAPAVFVQAERLSPPPGRSRDVDVVLDLMVHDLDLARHLLAEPFTEVRAIGVGRGAVDIAHARLETAGGRVAVLAASRVSRARHRVLRVFAEGAYYSLDLAAGRAFRVPWGRGRLGDEPLPVPPGDALDAELDAFLAAVRGEAAFPVAPGEGARAVELAGEVLRALRENEARRAGRAGGRHGRTA